MTWTKTESLKLVRSRLEDSMYCFPPSSRLTRLNFVTWHRHFTNKLRGFPGGVHKYVTTGEIGSIKSTESASKVENLYQQIMREAIIYTSSPEIQADIYGREETGRDLMIYLKNTYGTLSFHDIIILLRGLCTTKRASFTNFTTNINEWLQDFENIQNSVEPEIFGSLLYVALLENESLDAEISSLTEKDLRRENFKETLYRKAMLLKLIPEDSASTLVVSSNKNNKSNGNGKVCYRCHKKGHVSAKCPTPVEECNFSAHR